MTLKEKFEAELVFSLSRELHNEKCEKIADDYAIEFAEWVIENRAKHILICGNPNAKELLEQFKKENEL